MATALGAAVSDALGDGRVVSGVGGQFDFVAMAGELDDARSILMLTGAPRARWRRTVEHPLVVSACQRAPAASRRFRDRVRHRRHARPARCDGHRCDARHCRRRIPAPAARRGTPCPESPGGLRTGRDPAPQHTRRRSRRCSRPARSPRRFRRIRWAPISVRRNRPWSRRWPGSRAGPRRPAAGSRPSRARCWQGPAARTPPPSRAWVSIGSGACTTGWTAGSSSTRSAIGADAANSVAWRPARCRVSGASPRRGRRAADRRSSGSARPRTCPGAGRHRRSARAFARRRAFLARRVPRCSSCVSS